MPATIRAETQYPMWWKEYGRRPRFGERMPHQLIAQTTESLTVPLLDLKLIPGMAFLMSHPSSRDVVSKMGIMVVNDGEAPM